MIHAKKAVFGLAAAAMGLTLMFAGWGGWTAASAATEGYYYASVTETEGLPLLGQIHDLITKTHTRYTSYEDCKNPTYVQRTDPGPDGELMEFYAQAKLSATWESGHSGTWNREHVWCQSLSNGLWGQGGGGSDRYSNCVSTSIRDASYYSGKKYKIRRVKSLA